jgi:hypothetical protein
MVSANAYLGAGADRRGAAGGAEIVVCGRVADPSLTVGPVMAHSDGFADEWDRLGRATMAGHLLECGAQVTGGYFADPGMKNVPDLHAVGFPIAEIDSEGACVVQGRRTGGLVSEPTVKEQLLYEVHDPGRVISRPTSPPTSRTAEVRQVARDRVALDGVRGHARPARLKVNVCHEGGWLAEGEISYAGPGAEGARAPRRRRAAPPPARTASTCASTSSAR